MSEVLQANIFFLIASMATVIFCILLCMILFQFYKIAKSIRAILARIETASEVVAEDVAHVRQLIAKGGIMSSILNFMLGSSKRRTKSRARTDASD